MDCIACDNDNLRDYPVCSACEPRAHFTHRPCLCDRCAALPAVVVVTGFAPATFDEPAESYTGIDCPVCEAWRFVDYDDGETVTCSSCDSCFQVLRNVIPFLGGIEITRGDKDAAIAA